MYLWNNFGWF